MSDKNNNDKNSNINESGKTDIDINREEDVKDDVNIQIDKQEEDKTNINASKNNNSKKKIFLGSCVLALGLGALAFTQISNHELEEEFEDFTINNSETVKLEFTIKDNGTTRDRTPQEMREFYTPQGEEFIKTLYPDSSDSDLALVTIGKSISKEFSNIEFITADNKEIKLKNLKGKKIILDFALTSCPNCQDEFNYFSTKNIDNDTVLLRIYPRDTTEDIKQIHKDLGIDFTGNNTVSITGMNNLTFEDFNITHVPTKLYINEEGIVSYVTTHALLDDETYQLHYDRAFGNSEKVLDFLKTK